MPADDSSMGASLADELAAFYGVPPKIPRTSFSTRSVPRVKLALGSFNLYNQFPDLLSLMVGLLRNHSKTQTFCHRCAVSKVHLKRSETV